MISSLILFFLPKIVSMREYHLISTMRHRESRKALKKSISKIKSISDSPIDVYGSIHQAIIIYINSKTGRKSLEYSIIEIISIFEAHCNQLKDIELLKNIMVRGEAVRYASVSKSDIENDIKDIKLILKDADNVWT